MAGIQSVVVSNSVGSGTATAKVRLVTSMTADGYLKEHSQRQDRPRTRRQKYLRLGAGTGLARWTHGLSSERPQFGYVRSCSVDRPPSRQQR